MFTKMFRFEDEAAMMELLKELDAKGVDVWVSRSYRQERFWVTFPKQD